MKIKTKHLLILTLFTIPFFAFTCRDKVEGGHECITFINTSGISIDVIPKTKVHIEKNDTSFTCGDKRILPQDGIFIINSELNQYWETSFKLYSFIQIFVFSCQFNFNYCHDKENIKEFSDKYLLKRYQLTKEDLDRMDWTITYP
jgi:hypothetical protein